MTRKVKKEYSMAFKLGVIRDYYESGSSKNAIAKKWGLCNETLFSAWLKRLPVDEELLSLRMDNAEKSCETTPQSPEQELSERIKSLEKALAYEKMRSRAYEKMIEIAEVEEGISILKKGGAKQ